MIVVSESQNTTAFEVVQPNAAAMIESLRALGYSTKTAVADLIDNSISAGARNVWVNFFWDGVDSYVAICDDGGGMNGPYCVTPCGQAAGTLSRSAMHEISVVSV